MDAGGQTVPSGGDGFSIQVLSASSEAPSTLSIPGLTASTTVQELKSRIAEQIASKPPIARLRIIYRGRLIISDTATLAGVFGAEEVNDGTPKTIHLALKPLTADANTISSSSIPTQTSTPSGSQNIGGTGAAEASGPPAPPNGVLYQQLLPGMQPTPTAAMESSSNNGSEIPVSSMFEARQANVIQGTLVGGTITELLQTLNEIGSDTPTRTQALREYLILKNSGQGEVSIAAIPDIIRRAQQTVAAGRPQSYLLKDPEGKTYGIVASPGGFPIMNILPKLPRHTAPIEHPHAPVQFAQRLPVITPAAQHLPRRMAGPAMRPVVRRQFAVRIPANHAAFELLRGVLGFIFSNIWLWLRISVLAYFLVRYEPSYRSYFTFIICCITLVAAQLGLLDMLAPITRHIMQHLRDAVIFPQHAQPRPETEQATPVANSPDGSNTPTPTQESAGSRIEPTEATTPPAERPVSSLWSSIRTAERMVLVFLCSLIPGVGFEEMIAERFEVLRVEEREREEAAARAQEEQETSGEIDEQTEEQHNSEEAPESIEDAMLGGSGEISVDGA